MVFEHEPISHKLWDATSTDLNLCNFYLWGNLKTKVYSNNPHRLDVCKHNICKIITSIEVSELKLMSYNPFQETCSLFNSRREKLWTSTVHGV